MKVVNLHSWTTLFTNSFMKVATSPLKVSTYLASLFLIVPITLRITNVSSFPLFILRIGVILGLMPFLKTTIRVTYLLVSSRFFVLSSASLLCLTFAPIILLCKVITKQKQKRSTVKRLNASMIPDNSKHSTLNSNSHVKDNYTR